MKTPLLNPNGMLGVESSDAPYQLFPFPISNIPDVLDAAALKCDISLHLSPTIALAMLLAFSLCSSVIDYSVGYERQISRRNKSIGHGAVHRP
jgi:hypothetical protein